MANNEPKKGGILRAYLNFNVLYKILIGLVIGAVAGIILAASGVTALPKWISMFGTIFTRLLKMIIIPMIVGSLVVGASSVSPANVGKVGIRVVIIYPHQRPPVPGQRDRAPGHLLLPGLRPLPVLHEGVPG